MRLTHLFEEIFEDVKTEIIAQVSGLRADNEEDAKILDKIYRTLHDKGIASKVAQAFAVPTSDANVNLESLLKTLTQMIFHAGIDYKSLDAFLDRLAKGSVVDIGVLTTPGVGSVRAFFGGDETATKVFQSMATLGAGKKQKGPGEYALAMLSNQIKLKQEGGDIDVNGKSIEVKAETTSGGGRLGDGGPTNVIAKEYWSVLPSIAGHFASGSKGLGIGNFVGYIALDLPLNDPEKKRQRQDMLTKWYSQLFPNAAPFVQAFMQDDPKTAEKMYGKANFDSYKNNYKWDGLLSINFPSLKYVMVNTGDEFVKMKEAGHFGSFSVSVVPSAARPSEVYCQLSLTKAKV